MYPNCGQFGWACFEDIELTVKAFVFEGFMNLPAGELRCSHEIVRRFAAVIIMPNAVTASNG